MDDLVRAILTRAATVLATYIAGYLGHLGWVSTDEQTHLIAILVSVLLGAGMYAVALIRAKTTKDRLAVAMQSHPNAETPKVPA